MRHFADRLIEKIEETGTFGCLGLDPRPDWHPPLPVRCVPDAFVFGVLRAAAGKLPAVKPQAAFFGDEKSRVEPVTAGAVSLGMLSIGDAKRGDIGSTAEAYAEAWLGRDGTSDALTVNPYLGADSLEPFVKVAAREGRGIFVLVRTSNPGANDIQDLPIAAGPQHNTRHGTVRHSGHGTVCDAVAGMVHELGMNHIGERGYSLVGAVVGATVPAPIVARLRALMPRAIFLMPGLGAQGGNMDSIRAALDKNGLGVLAPSSRALNYPWKDKNGVGEAPEDWEGAIAKAVSDFAASLPVPVRA